MKRFDNPDVIITDVMDSHGKWRANKPAVICGDERITWGEFTRRINKVANGLIRRGLQRGDKVSLLSTNRIEVLEILFGTVKAGGVIVPLSTMVPGDSLARMVIDSDSRFLFVGPGQPDNIGPYRSGFSNIAADGFFALGEGIPTSCWLMRVRMRTRVFPWSTKTPSTSCTLPVRPGCPREFCTPTTTGRNLPAC